MDTKQAIRRMTHGGRIHRLVLGGLPKEMGRVFHPASQYRRELEQTVVEVKGEVSLTDAHWINEAVMAEVHCATCKWLLRTRLGVMTPAEIATCSREMLKAATTRNQAFAKLGLDRIQTNTIEALYSYADETDPTTPMPPDNATSPAPTVNQSSLPDDPALTRPVGDHHDPT